MVSFSVITEIIVGKRDVLLSEISWRMVIQIIKLCITSFIPNIQAMSLS